MHAQDKLLLSNHIVKSSFLKEAYADYLGMGRQGMLTMGGRGGVAPAGMGTSNLSRYSFTDGTPKAAPTMGAGDTSFPNAVGERSQFNEFQNTLAAAKQRGAEGMAKHRAQQAAPKNDMNALFKKYMGTAFDPNSRLDKAKMKYLQGLSDKGVTMNAANIYDKGQGYGNYGNNIVKSSFLKEAYGRTAFEIAKALAKKIPGADPLRAAIGNVTKSLTRQPSGVIGGRGGQIMRAGQPPTVGREFARETVGRPLISAGGAGGAPGAPLALPAPSAGGPLALPAPSAGGQLALTSPSVIAQQSGRQLIDNTGRIIRPSSASMEAARARAFAPAPSAVNKIIDVGDDIIDVGGVSRVVPTGLARARGGIRDVFGGLGEAARYGAGAAGRGLVSAGRGGLAVAKNPFTLGLVGGAVGGSLISGGRGSQATSAANENASTSPVGTIDNPSTEDPFANAPSALASNAPSALASNAPNAVTPGPINIAPTASNMPISQDALNRAAAAPAATRQMSPAQQQQAFKRYMGNFDSTSNLDRKKMQYLQDLYSRGVDVTQPGQAGAVYGPGYKF